MIHDAGLIIGDFCNGPLQKLIILIPSEDVSCINLILYIVETRVIAVGDDDIPCALNLARSFTTRLPKKVLPSSRVGS